MTQPVRIGIVGMGGFAGSHHNTVARLEERGIVRLVCACDPRRAAFAAEQQAWRFGPRGVRVFDDYRAMLEACHGDLDYVVTPTPIQLHAEMHDAITSFGLPAYVEKPPTLDYAGARQDDRRRPRARASPRSSASTTSSRRAASP